MAQETRQMSIFDIREQGANIISGIRFDDSQDLITADRGYITLQQEGYEIMRRVICKRNEIDNLIAGLEKAKELWGTN